MPLVALVQGTRTLATPDGSRRGTCPGCDTEMIAKTGEVLTHHWAHRYDHDAAPCQHEPETAWHLGWKARRTDPAAVEVAHGNRRADVVTPYGWAVEFQHSPLSIGEVKARERDWKRRMIWVFDTLDANEDHRLEMYLPEGRHHHTLRWAWSKAHVIAAAVPTFLHVDDEAMVLVGKWYEKEPDRPIRGYGWQLSVDEFAAHVINGAAPPRPPKFGEPLVPAEWSRSVATLAVAEPAGGTARPEPEGPVTAVLDWSSPAHWNGGKHVPCIHCGRPCFLLDDHGSPSNKTCAEALPEQIAEAA